MEPSFDSPPFEPITASRPSAEPSRTAPPATVAERDSWDAVRRELARRERDREERVSACTGMTERIVAASRAVRRYLNEALFDAGVWPGQEGLMMLLLQKPGYLRLEQTARRLDVSPQTLSRTIRRLEGTRMLTRQRDSRDGRFVFLSLTDVGKGCARQCVDVMADVDERLMDGWTNEEVRELAGRLGDIHRRAGSLLHGERTPYTES